MKKFLWVLFYISCIMIFYILINKYQFGYVGKLSDWLSFLSIAIGFCITSLSLIATTKFSRDLYEIQSKNKNNKTLLHELIDEFQNANNSFLLTITLIIIYSFIESWLACSIMDKVNFNHLFQAGIIFSIFISLYRFHRLVRIVGLYVIQAVKKQ